MTDITYMRTLSPGLPGEILLPAHERHEQAGIRFDPIALADEARPDFRLFASPDASHSARSDLVRHRGGGASCA